MNETTKELKLGLLGTGGKLIIDGASLRMQSTYGQEKFNIPLKDIQTVIIDRAGLGKAELKIIGAGTELTKVKMPLKWAEQCQAWILAHKNVQ